MYQAVTRIIREVQARTPLRRYFFPFYAYQFTVPQLIFLCDCIERTRGLDGAIAEIGCSNGATTVFLNKYMDAREIGKPYFALDTFAGFTAEDIDFEVHHRGKARRLYGGFRANKRAWFDETMMTNRISRVKSIQADVNTYDLTALGPLAFVLLDVDLYRPMKKAIPELYAALVPGGIIVLDDCQASNTRWDGSDQAYKEFMAGIGAPVEIVHHKLGVIRKQTIA